jgi:hypothetical protein
LHQVGSSAGLVDRHLGYEQSLGKGSATIIWYAIIMGAHNKYITFCGSRLKLVPQSIVLTAFIIPFGLLLVGYGFALARRDYVELSNIAFLVALTAFVGFLIWAQAHTVRRIAGPDLLAVTMSGLDLTIKGNKEHYSWMTLGQPEIRRLSEKTASRSITISKKGGGQLVIRAEEYVHRVEDILQALTQAKVGILVPLPEQPSQALYLYLAIPASILTLAIVLGGLGALLLS